MDHYCSILSEKEKSEPLSPIKLSLLLDTIKSIIDDDRFNFEMGFDDSLKCAMSKELYDNEVHIDYRLFNDQRSLESQPDYKRKYLKYAPIFTAYRRYENETEQLWPYITSNQGLKTTISNAISLEEMLPYTMLLRFTSYFKLYMKSV